MDYSNIVNRSANVVWQNKYLIVLGILASLGGSFGGGGGGGSGFQDNGSGQPFGDAGSFPDFGSEFSGVIVAVIGVLICLALLVAIALWVVSTIARGGLIAGVDAVESGERSNFSSAWRAGWQRAKSLLGISLLPAIPGLVLLIVIVLGLGVFGGFFALFGDTFAPVIGATGLGVTLAVVACIFIPIALILSILRVFAERACMLEGLGVVDAYRRGSSVLLANLGEAVMLFAVQLVIFIVLFAVLFVPGIIVVLCCLLWPLLLAFQGAVSAFISTMWTLAWHTWTGTKPLAEKAPSAI